MAAGIETIKLLSNPEFYYQLEARSACLEKGIIEAAENNGICIRLSRLGSIFTIFFTTEPVRDYVTACRADVQLYAKFFHQMLSHGIYLPPSQFEAAFVSTAHTDADIQATILGAGEAFCSLI